MLRRLDFDHMDGWNDNYSPGAKQDWDTHGGGYGTTLAVTETTKNFLRELDNDPNPIILPTPSGMHNGCTQEKWNETILGYFKERSE